MTDPPLTRPSLLIRLRDARDGEAWSEFVRLYGPLVYRFARRSGLQDADAADLVQDVLRAVSTAAVRLRYDPERGTFRGWLFTLAQRKRSDFLARRTRQERGSGADGMRMLLDDWPARDEADVWDNEYRRHLLTSAAEQVRGHFSPAVWQAFWQTAVEGRRGKEVAGELDMTVAAVYLARSRVMARLKRQIHEWEPE